MAIDRRRFLAVSAATVASIAGCVQAPEDEGQSSPTNPASRTSTQVTSPSPSRTNTPSGGLVIEGSEWVLRPDRFTTTRGTELTVTFKNVGTIAHNLTIGKFPASEHDIVYQAEHNTFLAQSETIQPGKTTSFTVTPDQVGEFPYWCDVSGHRQAGMVGTMVVE